MLFHEDMIYLSKQAKGDVEKKLCFEMRTVTKSNPELGFFSFVKTKKVCRCFASFSSEKEHFTYGMYIRAIICLSDLKN